MSPRNMIDEFSEDITDSTLSVFLCWFWIWYRFHRLGSTGSPDFCAHGNAWSGQNRMLFKQACLCYIQTVLFTHFKYHFIHILFKYLYKNIQYSLINLIASIFIFSLNYIRFTFLWRDTGKNNSAWFFLTTFR